MENIILIGFMGCGKSTVGLRLSYRLRRTIIRIRKLRRRSAEPYRIFLRQTGKRISGIGRRQSYEN